ncbi:GIY-YIG nuclease family protein [Methylobacterium sp. E-005]|uniref:GIY-YIG nuclease family protein n=1 Tax=Methylobacterium sp. E-005 TaxID=2836549 RepID=UPI001FBA8610|nr:GIY-YIG nuclease family protein [Methylobacterium sp. E-005]MCJ2084597.1 GIY-YIG nuclease family protein [Methylobacterium sp. E-005]
MRIGDHVYVIKGEHGRVKIGSSINPEQRCAELQTGSPVQLWVEHVAATLGPALPVELEAHAMLDRYRLNGEWFAVSVEVAVATIAAAAHSLRVPLSTGGLAFAIPDAPPYVGTRWLAGAALISSPFWALSAADRPFSALAYLWIALVFLVLLMLRERPPAKTALPIFAGSILSGIALVLATIVIH